MSSFFQRSLQCQLASTSNSALWSYCRSSKFGQSTQVTFLQNMPSAWLLDWSPGESIPFGWSLEFYCVTPTLPSGKMAPPQQESPANCCCRRKSWAKTTTVWPKIGTNMNKQTKTACLPKTCWNNKQRTDPGPRCPGHGGSPPVLVPKGPTSFGPKTMDRFGFLHLFDPFCREWLFQILNAAGSLPPISWFQRD